MQAIGDLAVLNDHMLDLSNCALASLEHLGHAYDEMNKVQAKIEAVQTLHLRLLRNQLIAQQAACTAAQLREAQADSA